MVMMADHLFTLSARDQVQILELNLLQTIDSSELDEMNEKLAQIVRDRPRSNWVFDVTRVEYTGSAVLGVMVNFRQFVKQSGGALVLCGMSPRLSEIFRTCSLDRLFKTVPTRELALRALS